MKSVRIPVPAFLCFLFVFFLSPSCLRKIARAQHKSTVSSEKLQLLKNRTTLLILPATEYAHLDYYKAMIPKAWTLTPIEVVRYNDLDQYAERAGDYAFFELGGIEKQLYDGKRYLTNSHYFLTLTISESSPGKKGKAKVKTAQLCRVELYPDFQTWNTGINKNMNDYLYKYGVFRNFQLPYVMAYLRFVQKNLQRGKDPWIYENYSDANLLQRLAKDTLYIPEDLVHDREKFTSKEKEVDDNFYQSYGGKYKLISSDDLTALVRDRDPSKPLFLFEYVLSSTDKYVGVLEINSGTVVYRKYSGVSSNLKAKDMKDILD